MPTYLPRNTHLSGRQYQYFFRLASSRIDEPEVVCDVLAEDIARLRSPLKAIEAAQIAAHRAPRPSPLATLAARQILENFDAAASNMLPTCALEAAYAAADCSEPGSTERKAAVEKIISCVPRLDGNAAESAIGMARCFFHER